MEEQVPDGGEYDAIVVGLGPVGAMCAGLLCGRGCRVLVLEQTPSESLARPRAIAMDADGMRLLQQLGLLEAFLADADPGRGGQFITPEGRFLNGFLPQEGQGRPGAWTGGSVEFPESPQGTPGSVFFYQPRLEELLRQSLKRWGDRCTIAFGAKLVGFEEGADSVTARLQRSSAEWKRLPTGEVAIVERAGSEKEPCWEVHAQYLIGCDGSKSVVSRELNAEAPSRHTDLDFDEEWCVVDAMLLDESAVGRELPYMTVQICDKARKVTYMTGSWVTDRPQRGRHIRWEFEVLRDDDREQVASHKWLQDSFLSRWLVPSQYELIRSAVYRFHSVLARQWCSVEHGRVFLAGDAAHQNPPFNGQGLTGGFRDVANLSWKLVMALKRPALRSLLLRTYQEERYPHMHDAVLASVETGKLIQTFCDAKAEDLDAVIKENATRGYGRLGEETRRTVGLFAFGSGLAGEPCPQPSLHGRPLDTLLGQGFALLLNSAAPLTQELPEAPLAPLELVVLRLSREELAGQSSADLAMGALLRKYGAVLVRPDRLIYGAVRIGEPPGAVMGLLGRLREQLGLQPPAPLSRL